MSVPSAEQLPEEARRITELATLIAGEERPVEDWLHSGLQKAAEGLWWTIKKDSRHPNREVLRGKVQSTLDAARLIRERLKDVDFIRTRAAASQDDVHDDNAAYQILGSIIDRTEKALAKFPVGQGPHKYAPGTNTPLAVCALIVAFAWRRVRGQLPPHTSPQAQEACRLLWTLAGGDPRGFGGSQSVKGWRTHLRGAKADLKNGPRPEVQAYSIDLHPKRHLAAFHMSYQSAALCE